MSCIYENQPLLLESTITIDGLAPENIITSALYDYWVPGNNTSTPSGTWIAAIIDGSTGEIEYQIESNILSTPGIWKTQTRATSAGLEYPSCMDSFIVNPIGS